MEKKGTLILSKISSLSYKHSVLAFVIILGVLISNDLLFKWVKNIGWSENDTYDLSDVGLLDFHTTVGNHCPFLQSPSTQMTIFGLAEKME